MTGVVDPLEVMAIASFIACSLSLTRVFVSPAFAQTAFGNAVKTKMPFANGRKAINYLR
jgi:hypothetical protein